MAEQLRSDRISNDFQSRQTEVSANNNGNFPDRLELPEYWYGDVKAEMIEEVWDEAFDSYKLLREGKKDSLPELLEYPTLELFANGLLTDPNVVTADIGSGLGYWSERVFKGSDQSPKLLFSVDISNRFLEYSRNFVSNKHYKDKVRFVQASADDLPLPDDKFDFLTSVHTIHYAPNTQKAINEMFRITKPGGLVLMITKHPDRNAMVANQVVSRANYRTGGTWYLEGKGSWAGGSGVMVRHFSFAEWIRMFNQAGFYNVSPFDLQMNEKIQHVNPGLYEEYASRGVPAGLLLAARKPN